MVKTGNVFDSAGRHFILNALETFGFVKNIAMWIKTLLKK